VPEQGAQQQPEPVLVDEASSPTEPEPATADLELPPRRTRRRRRRDKRRAKQQEKQRRRRRVIPGALAAILAGVVVGGFGTGSTYGALRGCEALNGTDSCGGPGLLGLLAIVVLMGLVGALLLRLMRVADPGSTSFLGIGLLCVVVLVALMEELFSVWMFVAIPLLTAVCYAVARWVTTRFVQPYEKEPGPDVR
jgi:drug/metabolite transporter (DMT)-like permease